MNSKKECNQNSILGRIRNIPHIEGNFATTIYLKIPKFFIDDTKINKLKEYFEKIGNQDNTNDNQDYILSLNKLDSNDYHLSISKTYYLKYHQINLLLTKLKNHFKLYKNGMRLIISNNLINFCNEYGNNCFIAFEVLKNLQFNKIYSSVIEVIENLGIDLSNSSDKKRNIDYLIEKGDYKIIINKEKKGYLKILDIDDLYIKIGSKIQKINLNNLK